MKTLLICHEGDFLRQDVMARWLASFSELTGVVVLVEKPGRRWERIRREIRRSGWPGFLNVIAFRLYYRLFLASRDAAWEKETAHRLCDKYAPIPEATPMLRSASVNAPETKAFVEAHRPDLALALCKQLLKRDVFSIPRVGTLVMHPGICPEYRNAHGCFWALAKRDLGKVGLTLLKIDEGVDTGPVYGYYSYDFDERAESHNVIQYRVFLENLDALQAKFDEIVRGVAVPLNTTGRASATWGQPRLTNYLAWKAAARKRSL